MQYSQLNRTEKEDHEKDNPALSKVFERLHTRELSQRYAS